MCGVHLASTVHVCHEPKESMTRVHECGLQQFYELVNGSYEGVYHHVVSERVMSGASLSAFLFLGGMGGAVSIWVQQMP